MISLCPFWRSISSRSSCSRAFKRSAAIDDDRRSSGGDVLPLVELLPPAVTEIGGDSGGDEAAILVKNSEWDVMGLLADWCAECCAADILASNDWNDALGEYNAPTPGGRIGDGGALHEWIDKKWRKEQKKTVRISTRMKETKNWKSFGEYARQRKRPYAISVTDMEIICSIKQGKRAPRMCTNYAFIVHSAAHRHTVDRKRWNWKLTPKRLKK